MLICNADMADGTVDVLLSGDRIEAIWPSGQPRPAGLPAGPTIDAQGGALLPGLHDHHLHLLGLAAARNSVVCGPSEVRTESSLRQSLSLAAARSTETWIRGIGYHESVAGNIDRHWIDRAVPDQPVRIQHRSGRLWVLNSAALSCLPDSADGPLERIGGTLTGRLYDADRWLRQQLTGVYPPVADTCMELAHYGVTGFTDASVSNDAATFLHLSSQVRDGLIPQAVSIMGDSSLSGVATTLSGRRASVGAFKVHLHEHALPDVAVAAAAVAVAHHAGRVAAFHCVTQAELLYALAILDESGSLAGDRIEHAATVSDELLSVVADRGVVVVTQPHFILERGDQYRRDIPACEHGWLYRCAAWRRHGVALAAGSDAPYGSPNPWIAMQAAVDRRTLDGHQLGPAEAMSPEQALAMYLSPLSAPGHQLRSVAVGAHADLCLIDRPWRIARMALAAVRVRATVCQGRLVAPADSRPDGLA
jgi:predicted amidohydrolase YtcJ